MRDGAIRYVHEPLGPKTHAQLGRYVIAFSMLLPGMQMLIVDRDVQQEVYLLCFALCQPAWPLRSKICADAVTVWSGFPLSR